MLHRHPVLGILTVAYLAFVGWVTLTPQPYDGRTASVLERFLDFFARHDATDWITFDRVEAAANVVMFVPVGLFFVLLFGRRLWFVAIIAGALFSVGIEYFQLEFLPSRVADVRDVLTNTAGTILGVLLGLVLSWPKARRISRDRRAVSEAQRTRRLAS
ncbi:MULTISPECIES: VanZ family protein [unclassified Leifsonia]|uniref:VanZ family protein n=1 Tax=unclassified Leifsonia TaxID=2663824 RepID=UPI0006FD0FA1|nr:MULTISPECIES: VanZ family protein [unclassified Leifsonia]KQX06608.1 hypothetical protein ASC59_01740 [Leifsonia sp. Root1293]KRA10892.1 hypothetical protein ASD61_01740 [Leifsonia sp. Root60]